jgi:hypothetical protein
MSINTAFSRELLKRVLEEVRAYRKATGDRFAFKLTDAWIYRVGTDHWEFHFGEFYWHGSADNAFEARAKGWSSWLAAKDGTCSSSARARRRPARTPTVHADRKARSCCLKSYHGRVHD